ncbi:MAG: hypothetical protein LBL18_03400 [Bacteroidales bacterium]|jgi:hypothetical protein|nr:hypothetical protein [Bacteroidales bacterium]
METAVNIIREAVRETSLKMFDSESKITFSSGYTSTIINEITLLTISGNKSPFPLIAMFTEQVTESISNNILTVTIPKIVICCRAVENLTEKQRIATSFKKVLHPIFEEFQKQLIKLNLSYNLTINRSDVPYYTESNSKSGKFNEMVDGIIIKNLKIKVLIKNC